MIPKGHVDNGEKTDSRLTASFLSACQGGPVLETIIPDPKVIVRTSA